MLSKAILLCVNFVDYVTESALFVKISLLKLLHSVFLRDTSMQNLDMKNLVPTKPFSVAGFLLLLSFALFPYKAFAIPSFAAQTGQPCSACHVGAFGPQLKPYGRDFKLYGYVTSDRPKDNLADNWPERFSMMMKSSFNHINTDKNPAPAAGLGPNDNFTLDQVALYYGGRITPEIGLFQEVSYDGVNHNFFWDALDVRHAWDGTLFGTDYVGGILVGNQLGETSIWNSTPPNAFPYNSSGVAPDTGSRYLVR